MAPVRAKERWTKVKKTERRTKNKRNKTKLRSPSVKGSSVIRQSRPSTVPHPGLYDNGATGPKNLFGASQQRARGLLTSTNNKKSQTKTRRPKKNGSPTAQGDVRYNAELMSIAQFNETLDYWVQTQKLVNTDLKKPKPTMKKMKTVKQINEALTFACETTIRYTNNKLTTLSHALQRTAQTNQPEACQHRQLLFRVAMQESKTRDPEGYKTFTLGESTWKALMYVSNTIEDHITNRPTRTKHSNPITRDTSYNRCY